MTCPEVKGMLTSSLDCMVPSSRCLRSSRVCQSCSVPSRSPICLLASLCMRACHASSSCSRSASSSVRSCVSKITMMTTQKNDGNTDHSITAAMLAQALSVAELLLLPRLELAKQRGSPCMRASNQLCWHNSDAANFLCLSASLLIASDRMLDLHTRQILNVLPHCMQAHALAEQDRSLCTASA